jgi:AcrR family transcriptional regulator
MSRRTFYEIFEDCEDCLLAALDDAIARLSARVLQAYDLDVRWSERVREGLAAALAFFDDEPALAQLAVVETLVAGPGALERRRHLLAKVIAVVDCGRTEAKAIKGSTPLTAEGVVGGVLSILHSRILTGKREALIELTGPLMSTIVLPYLGVASAQAELRRPPPPSRKRRSANNDVRNPLAGLQMRLTYRTVRILTALAANPGGSNRQIALAAGIDDQGQASKLLARLKQLDLAENMGIGQVRGAPNAWMLTEKGIEVERFIALRSGEPADR